MEERIQKQPSGCWQIIRWCIAMVVFVIFTIWITLGIPLSATSRTLTQRGHIKYWLLASGVYEQPVTLMSNIIIHTVPGDSALLPLALQAQNKNSALRQTLNTIIYPAFAQYSVHTIINATYDWLEGKTSRPDFSIALLPNTTAASALIAQLPQEADATHVIPTVDDVVRQTTFSSASLPINDNTSAVVRQGFMLAVLLPGVMVAGSLILITMLLIIIPNRRRSFMVVGITLLSLGSIFALTELVLIANVNTVLRFVFSSTVPPSAAWIGETFQAPIQLAGNDILTRAARYSVALAASGGILIGCALLSQLPFQLFFAKHQVKAATKKYH